MIEDVPPARLHILMARRAPYAVIIRRGPAKQVCTIGWDRRSDTFEIGQWFNGRIYEKRADISPDGRYLIYFAANFNWNSETKGTWTAISRAPYIKAISIWAKGDTYFGGGLFLNNTTALLHGHHGNALELSPDIRLVEDARGWSSNPGLKDTIAHTGAHRVGSLLPYLTIVENEIYESSLHQRFGSYRLFEQYRAGWTLDVDGIMESPQWGKGRNATKHWWLKTKTKTNGYQLINRNNKSAIDLPEGTTWAEVDDFHCAPLSSSRARIVWVKEGKLFAACLMNSGLSEHQLLYDFNPLKFKLIKAPY